MKPAAIDLKLARIVSLVITAIFILLPFHTFFTTWLASNLGYHDPLRIWKEILLLFTLPVAVYLAWRAPKLSGWLKRSWIIRLIVIYIFAHLSLGSLALAAGTVNLEALTYALIVNLRFFAFFLLCLIAATYSGFLRAYWYKILILPAALVVVFGLLQKLILPYDFLKHFGYGTNGLPAAYQIIDQQADLQRIQSTLRGANPLGAYLVLIITALSVIWRKNRIVLGAGLALSAIALYFTHSRSAWVGAIVSGGFLGGFILSRRFGLKSTVVIYLSLFVLATITLIGFRQTAFVQEVILHDRQGVGAALNSNETRFQSLKHASNQAVSEPFGRGPGTAGPASLRNDKLGRIAENYYLQLVQEVGIIGAALFVAINILVVIKLWARRNENLAKILLASIAGITFINLVSHAWTDDTLAYLWWGMAGVALAPALYKKTANKTA